MNHLSFNKQTFFTGRNGTGKQSGIEVLTIEGLIMLYPLTSKNKTANCNINIPQESLPDFIKILQSHLPDVEDENYTISENWCVADVLKQAVEDEVIITAKEAREILDWIDRKHDATIGINWDVITAWTDMWLRDNGRGDYLYSTIEYNDNAYTCREIPDLDNEGETVTIAPQALLDALQNTYGTKAFVNCPEDEDVAYYAQPDEILLPNEELFKIAYH